MFKKLLSNLPFNPSLIGQVSFYAKRLHAEDKLRRTGLILVVLSVFVQMFAVISPPEPTLAESNNDIIRGGITHRDQAVLYCLNSKSDFGKIMAYYNISCELLAQAATVNLKSTDYNKKLHSMGRLPQGQTVARTGKPTNEYPVNIPGANGGKPLWMRNLWAWDSGASSTYKALKINAPYGTIYVLFSCGNIVTIDRYSPPPPPPPPAPKNSKPAANFNANCTAVTWRATDNDGAPRVRIYIAKASGNSDDDWKNKGAFAHSVKPTWSGNGNDGQWSIPEGYRNATTRYRVFVVVSDKLPNGAMDDTNFVRATPASGALFGPCIKNEPEPEPKTPPAPQPPAPPNPVKVVACGSLRMSLVNKAHVKTGTAVEFRGQAVGRNMGSGDKANLEYEIINTANNQREGSKINTRGVRFNNGVATDNNWQSHTFTSPGTYQLQLAVSYEDDGRTKTATGNNSRDCIKQITIFEADPCPNSSGENCLEYNKTAANVTQGIEDANNTMARGDDVIVYALSVTNTGNEVVKDFVFQENLSDVLQYADIVDLDGGKKDDHHDVEWPAVDIKPNSTVEKKIKVKVKNPIPQTPVSVSDPSAYDLVMTNVFFDKSVNIELPGSTAKTTEEVVSTLPSTGPGENMAVAVTITIVISYFFARNRLMAKEVDIVRTDYATTGGV